MRLIDADVLKEDIKKYTSVFARYDWREICEMLNDAPTVEPKHGYWYVSDHDGYFQCSECDSYAHETELGNYCSSCGAKMDEVEDESHKV